MTQIEIFAIIVSQIKKIQNEKSKPIRVAVNGIEGTGKTTFASALVKYLNGNRMKAVHVSIDGYHFNKEVRYRQGRDSSKGYYENSYNEAAFVEHVLQRSQGSPPEYVEATHDLVTDEYLDLCPKRIEDDTVLVTDGCYLLKPIFNDFWDFRIYLKTDFETAKIRGAKRDQDALGGYDEARRKFELRYHAASKLYISDVNPENLADLIIDNTDFECLKVVSSC